MMDKRINICLSCDENYTKYAGVVIASILSNAHIDDEILNVDDSQDCGLCKINNKNNVGINANEAFERIVVKYPQLIEILRKEKDA